MNKGRSRTDPHVYDYHRLLAGGSLKYRAAAAFVAGLFMVIALPILLTLATAGAG